MQFTQHSERNCKNQTEPQNTKNLEYGQRPEKCINIFVLFPFFFGQKLVAESRGRGRGSVFAAVAAAASQLQIFGNSTKTGGGAEEASEARTIGRMGSPFPIPSTEYAYPAVGMSRVY